MPPGIHSTDGLRCCILRHSSEGWAALQTIFLLVLGWAKGHLTPPLLDLPNCQLRRKALQGMRALRAAIAPHKQQAAAVAARTVPLPKQTPPQPPQRRHALPRLRQAKPSQLRKGSSLRKSRPRPSPRNLKPGPRPSPRLMPRPRLRPRPRQRPNERRRALLAASWANARPRHQRSWRLLKQKNKRITKSNAPSERLGGPSERLGGQIVPRRRLRKKKGKNKEEGRA